VVGVVQEAALAGVCLAGLRRVRVVQAVHVPAAPHRERRDRVDAVRHQTPQVLRRVNVARVPAGHAHDGDRLVGANGDGRGARGAAGCAEEFGPQPGGERGRRRVVEDQGCWQPQAGGGVEAVAQLDGGERVEAQLAEGDVGLDGLARRVAEHGRHMRTRQVQQDPLLLGLGAAGDPLPQVTTGRPPCGYPDEAPQQGRRRAAGGEGAQVEVGGDDGRPAEPERGVEEGQSLVGGQRDGAGAGEPGAVGLVEVAGHAAAVRPESPGEGGGW
jgi:hypothetical protein